MVSHIYRESNKCVGKLAKIFTWFNHIPDSIYSDFYSDFLYNKLGMPSLRVTTSKTINMLDNKSFGRNAAVKINISKNFEQQIWIQQQTFAIGSTLIKSYQGFLLDSIYILMNDYGKAKQHFYMLNECNFEILFEVNYFSY